MAAKEVKPKRGRPKAEEPKKMYAMYFRPSFMKKFQKLAKRQKLTTSQLIEKTFKE